MEMQDVKAVYESYVKARETTQETELPTEAVLPWSHEVKVIKIKTVEGLILMT